MKPISDNEGQRLFGTFGIDNAAVMAAAADKPAMLRELKSIVKFVYKAMAVSMHPDHGGDAERWKEITAAYNAIGDLAIQPGPPVRSGSNPFVGIRIDFNGGWPWTTTTAASGTTTG